MFLVPGIMLLDNWLWFSSPRNSHDATCIIYPLGWSHLQTYVNRQLTYHMHIYTSWSWLRWHGTNSSIHKQWAKTSRWRFSFWWHVDLDQRSYSTPGSVSARMGDHLRASKLHVSRYVISHRGQLRLAIPPWVGTMSTGLGWEGNHRSGVALAIRHTQ